MSKKTNKKKWMKFRHKVVTVVGSKLMYPYTRLKYHVKMEPFKEENGRQYLILLNHQTVFDQFFLGLTFKKPVYYIATEDIFSNGFVSSIIRFLIAPIPIKKQTTDIKAVMNCLRVAKEGGNICIAPEGNRTYSGKTEYMNPAIMPLVKKLGLPLAFFRIEGGYGIEPRWSNVTRKGKMRSYISRVVEPEEYKSMTDEELLALIKEELYVNEACVDGTYVHKNSAEYLERAIYVCPYCGLSEFESSGDKMKCKKCDLEIQYLPTKELKANKEDFSFLFVNDWYEYQAAFVNNLDTQKYNDTPMYRDTASVSEVIVYKNKVKMFEDAAISLYGNRIEIYSGTETKLVFNFEETDAVSVLGRNKLNIYHKGKVYQFKGGKRFNALKYVHIYYRFKNITTGDENEQFLGL